MDTRATVNEDSEPRRYGSVTKPMTTRNRKVPNALDIAASVPPSQEPAITHIDGS